MNKIRVGVNGYGVIGKRVADAVYSQDDMELVGISDIISDVRLNVAKQRGYNIYCSIEDFGPRMESAGFQLTGGFSEFLENSDVVIDCTPAGIPIRNFPDYEKHGVKVIVQGGEKHNLTGSSFSSFGNYEEGMGKEKLRVVSCNTTALTRIFTTIHRDFGVEEAFVALARRAADPVRTNKGPINGVVPVLGVSHHGPDVETVVAALKGKIYSLAIAGSFTLSHVHMLRVQTTKPVTKKEVIETWNLSPRIIVGKGQKGLFDTAQLVEYYRDLGRLRYDRPEVFIWEETIDVDSRGNLYFIIDVHMESIPIPENIDAIRAMMNTESDPLKCIHKTDKALGIAKDSNAYSRPLGLLPDQT